jgi:uncharacterized protein (DUF1778 family)
MNKDERLYIRFTDEEKRLVQRAAQAEDLKPSTWMRQLALKAARRLEER